MNKPFKEWLAELPDGYRERALKNYDPPPFVNRNRCAASIEEAICAAFDWSESPEGEEFWNDVWRRVVSYDSLPPLPSDFVAKGTALASDHNPDNLTDEQVGVAEGWRLLTEEERIMRHRLKVDNPSIEMWASGEWLNCAGYGFVGGSAQKTYRTKHPPGYFLKNPKESGVFSKPFTQPPQCCTSKPSLNNALREWAEKTVGDPAQAIAELRQAILDSQPDTKP